MLARCLLAFTVFASVGCLNRPSTARDVGVKHSGLEFTVAIDATALTEQQLYVYETGSYFNSKAVQHLQLAPGVYQLLLYSGNSGSHFTVTPSGTIEYDTSYDATFSGRGTNTLVLNAFSIDIDATSLAQQQLSLYAIGSNFDSKVVQHRQLTSGVYQLMLSSGNSGSYFTVSLDGTVDYDLSHNAAFSGRGTNTLVLNPFSIKIDATSLTQQQLSVYTIGNRFDSKTVQQLQLTPGIYNLLLSSENSGSYFTVNVDGTVDYDASYNAAFSGRGTSTLVLNAFTINIDATSLTQQQLTVYTIGSYFDSKLIQQLQVTPGIYNLLLSSQNSGSYFTVNLDGTIDYDTSYDTAFAGRGTNTLVLNAFSINIDATALPEQQVRVYTIGSYVDSNTVQSLQLTPGIYALQLDSGNNGCYFTVKPDGTVDYDPLLNNVLSGRGTNTLLVTGLPATVMFDATALTQKSLMLSPSGAILDTATPQGLRIGPGVYTLQPANLSDVSFAVNADNTIDYDASLEGILAGKGTGNLRVIGRRISIDATSLSQTSISPYVVGALPFFGTHSAADLVLVPAHGYEITLGSGLLANLSLDLDLAGNIHFSSDYAGIASGDGTPSLIVMGAQVSITPYMSHSSLEFANLWGDPLAIPTGQTSNLKLLPLHSGTAYKFIVGSGAVTTFGFNLDLSGNVTYDHAFDGYVQGRNTPSLTINAPTITIDASPDGPGQFEIGGVGTFDRSQRHTLQLMPVEGGYQYSDDDGTFVFTVKEDGTIDYDSSLDNRISGRGTATLTDSPNSCIGLTPAQTGLTALESGWELPGQVCIVPTGVTVPTDPVPYLTMAKMTPTGSSPLIAPKPATVGLGSVGGAAQAQSATGPDSVLADGEFYLQRIDAQMAGFGPHYEFKRTYRSGVSYRGPLGASWDHNYDKRLIGELADSSGKRAAPGTPYCGASIDYYDGELNTVRFKRTSSPCPATGSCVEIFAPPAGIPLTLEHQFQDSSGTRSSSWKMTDASSNTLAFDDYGFLAKISDLAGNALTFIWDRDHLRLSSVSDGAHPTINYLYDTKGLLCVTQGADCGTSTARTAGVLAYFEYTTKRYPGSSDDVPLLAKAYRGQSTHSEQYTYGSNTPSDPASGIAPKDCLPNPSIEPGCRTLCGKVEPANYQDTCFNQDWADKVSASCSEFANLFAADPYAACRTAYVAPPERNSSPPCKAGTGAPINDFGYSRTVPCLVFGDLIPESYQYPNGFIPEGQTPVNMDSPVNCFTACLERNQCWAYFDAQSKWMPFYTSGRWADLENNITDVWDENGNVVVHNEYGTDLRRVSFDRVTWQTLGLTLNEVNTVHYDYHDLEIETNGYDIYSLRNLAYDFSGNRVDPVPSGNPYYYLQDNGGANWDGTAWLGDYSIPNSDVLSITALSGEVVCPPSAVAGTGPTYQTYQAPQPLYYGDIFPKTAVAITDMHENTRVQYFDGNLNLIRQDARNGANTETSYYSYNPNNQLIGIHEASGVRTCYERDWAGHPIQVTRLANPEYPGDATPLVDLYVFDAQQQVVDVYNDVAHGMSAMAHAHLQRDSQTDLVVEMDQSGGSIPSSAPLVTTYSYTETDHDTVAAGVREIPASVTLPDRTTVNQYRQLDRSMGGPTITVLDVNGQRPKQLYAKYDPNNGNLIESGESGRSARQFIYDPITKKLQQMNHRPNSSSPWIQVGLAYHSSGDGIKIDSVTEAGRGTNFDYSAGSLFPSTMRYAPIGGQAAGEPPLPAQQVTCFHYSADGRLNDVILPEGNKLHYDYDGLGRVTQLSKGFAPPASPAPSWAAACPAVTPPTGDPGFAPIQTTTYFPGGFLASFSTNDIQRSVVNDGFGRVIQVHGGPSSASTVAVHQWGYDGYGRVIWEASLAPGTGLPANPYQKPTTATVGLLRMTEYSYDVFGRTTLIKAWAIQAQQFITTATSYDDLLRKVTITEQVIPWSGQPTDAGRTTRRLFDGLGRLVQETLPDTSIRLITYAIIDGVYTGTVVQQTNQTDPQTHLKVLLIRKYQFDTRGNLTAILDESGNTLVSASYDDDGNLLTSQEAGTGSTKRLYDRFGRQVHVDQDLLNGSSTPTDLGWDRNDRRTSYSDGERNQWTTLFSGLDQPLTLMGPAGSSKTLLYTPGFASHPGGMVESNGRQTCYRYDQDMQLAYVYDETCPAGLPIIGPATPLLEKEYTTHTVLGQVDTVTAHQGATRPADASVRFIYDSIGRPTDQIVSSGSSTVPSYTVHHDFIDQLLTVKTSLTQNAPNAPLPVWLEHRFDSQGRLGKVLVDTAQLATYDYGTSGVGGPISRTDSNGAVAAFTYDAKLRQTGIDVTFTPIGGQPSLVASLHEAFGSDSVPRMRQRQIGTGPAMTDLFQVDGDRRLTGENLQLAGLTIPNQEIDNNYPTIASNITTGAAWRGYTLDNIGNWKAVATSGGSVAYPVDGLSRLTAIGSQQTSIDSTDNIRGLSGDPSLQFGFDAFTGALLTATSGGITGSYVYDALGRRALETRSDGLKTAFLWDGQTIVAHGDPGTPDALTIDIPSDDVDGRVATVEMNGTGKARFYHQGPDQSVLAVSDENGIVEGYSYSAFGEASVWSPTGARLGDSSFGNRFLFQGQLYDPLSGTYAMRARQYQPKWGRFLSPDPLLYGAAPSLYSFTGSRPLSARDPLGLGDCDVSFCGTAGDPGGGSGISVGLGSGGSGGGGGSSGNGGGIPLPRGCGFNQAGQVACQPAPPPRPGYSFDVIGLPPRPALPPSALPQFASAQRWGKTPDQWYRDAHKYDGQFGALVLIGEVIHAFVEGVGRDNLEGLATVPGIGIPAKGVLALEELEGLGVVAEELEGLSVVAEDASVVGRGMLRVAAEGGALTNPLGLRGEEAVGAGVTRVSRWMSEEEAYGWVNRYSVPQPAAGPNPPRTFVTSFGASQPGGTGPVRVDFNVPTQALKGAGREGWFTIFNDGLYVPIHDVTIVRP